LILLAELAIDQDDQLEGSPDGEVNEARIVRILGGSTFQLVPGADPICGTVISGVTVAPSS
jgi:hypothetical protein